MLFQTTLASITIHRRRSSTDHHAERGRASRAQTRMDTSASEARPRHPPWAGHSHQQPSDTLMLS